jgi:hypothetical protein
VINNEEMKLSEKRMPTTADTLLRREVMVMFFPKLSYDAERSVIESISRQFVRNWHKKTMRMLL